MYMSSLLITLLLIALVEPCSCWVCPKASDSSSALSYSLHCCCKNLHLTAQTLYKATCVVPVAEFEMLLSFVREDDHPLTLPRQQADRLPGLQLLTQPVSWKLLSSDGVTSEKQQTKIGASLGWGTASCSEPLPPSLCMCSGHLT